jgi:uncharacterized protein YceH (UPF0502 family)
MAAAKVAVRTSGFRDMTGELPAPETGQTSPIRWSLAMARRRLYAPGREAAQKHGFEAVVSAGFGSGKGIEALGPSELRVLGCLLEKQRTTPEQYPLSLNSLRLACNQSTNRDPVVDYDEATIRDALHRLERRGLVRFASGSRAAKYRHLLAEALPLDGGEHAVMAVLMLRGAQTPGELKQRTERMHSFADLAGAIETLERLVERELVVRLDRRPGQKEERYALLLERDDEPSDATPSAIPPPSTASAPPTEDDESDDLRERVERLEREVAELRASMRNASPGAPSVAPRPNDDPRRFDPRL